MLTTLKKLHCALKRETGSGNFLIKIQGLDENYKFFRAVFYVTPDLEEYLLNTKHEIKRAMPFDNSEWVRSESWEKPAEKLVHDDIDHLLMLYSKRDEVISKHLESLSTKEQTAYLITKNNLELRKLGFKPKPAVSNSK